MKPIEDVDVEKLVEVCKALNEHLEQPISVIDVAVIDLIKSFTDGVESLSEEAQEALPDLVADFYNDLYEDEADEEDEQEKGEGAVDPAPDEETASKKEEKARAKEEKALAKEEKARAKQEAADKKKADAAAKKAEAAAKKKADAAAKKAAKKKPSKKKDPSVPFEKDEYGFVVGSKNHLFAQAIKAAPLTMTEVRELPWNTAKNTHYDAYNKMKRNGQADRDEEGRMSAK